MQKRDVKIFAFIVMENHLHLIVTGVNLSEKIGNMKSYTARRIIDYLVEKKAKDVLFLLQIGKADYKTDQKYQVWQEGSRPQQIDTEQMMLQKIEYIHNNPIKRGYIENPAHWLCSSARNYAGIDTWLDIDLEW
jgi:putative transposase